MIDITKLHKLSINGGTPLSLIDVDPQMGTNDYRVILIPSDVNELFSIETVDSLEEFDEDGVLISKTTKYGVIQDLTINKAGVYRDLDMNPISTATIVFSVRDIQDAVSRLEEKVFPNQNTQNMNIEEFKENKVKQLGESCKNIIYSGADLVVNGVKQHFSFTENDQQNISSLANIAMSTEVSLPYHADGQQCVLYSWQDIIRLYAKMQSHILYHTTYCNALNTYVRSLSDRVTIQNISYGQGISDANIVTIMNEALTQGSVVINAVLDKYGLILDEPEESISDDSV